MVDKILPAYWRYPDEGAIVGRLLAGYGELEFELADCLSAVLGDQDQAFRVMFRTRGEEQRIQTADALMRNAYAAIDQGEAFAEMISDLGWCKRIRNRYAHCHWDDHPSYGLCYFDLEGWAKKNVALTFVRNVLTVEVLEQQEAYFRYVQSSLWHLQAWMKRSRRVPTHWVDRPAKLARPRDHVGEVPYA